MSAVVTSTSTGGGGRSTASARSAGARIGRRFGAALIVLLGAVTVTFLALQMVPGSVVDAVVGQSQVTPEVRAQIAQDYALDQSLLSQYRDYIWRLLHGDLGRSYSQGLPVTEVIGHQIGSSLALVGAGVTLALITAVLVATFTANRPRWVRSPFTALEAIGVAIPAFWLGILLLTIFSFQLHWFPAIGANQPNGLVLPAIALAVAPAALMSQVLRQALERTLDEPFVVTVRARGVGNASLLLRHALRHALLPVVTLAGWLIGALIGGAVVIETVFSRQGLGQLAVASINTRDFPVVSGIVVISAASFVVLNLLVDALYPVLDPRLRDDGARTAHRQVGS